MDLHIRDRSALVTAAGGGLGGAIASALADEGVRVVVADLSLDRAESIAHRIRSKAGTAVALQFDLADFDSFPRHLDQIHDQVGPLSILVNVTGGPPPASATSVTPAMWRMYFDAMVLGVIHLTDLVLPDMRSTQWGRIITSTSSGIIAPIAGLGISNSLRQCLVGWSKTLAREVAADGITVNTVVPGRIATQRVHELDESHAAATGRPVSVVISDSVSGIPLGRYGRSDEYAAVVAFLAGQPASYVTGSIVRVDGGMIAAI